MPYCRKCGAKLDEDASFCRICGTPVPRMEVTAERRGYRGRSPILWPVVSVVVVVLAVLLILSALAIVPVNQVNFNQSNVAPAVLGISAVNLDFEADSADIRIFIVNAPNELVRIDSYATGSTNIFSSSAQPIKVTFTNQTQGSNLTVTAKVTREQFWPLSFGLNVTCNIYIDQSATVNLDARTSVGKITMNADTPIAFEGLSLQSTTGSVEASVGGEANVAGRISASTTTGSVEFTWSNVKTTGNIPLSVSSTTGSLTVDVTQSRQLGGDVTVDASTTTGSVNFGIDIQGDIGAQITSHTNVGSITVDAQSFNGNKSPISSSNYPGANNFQVNLGATTGSIHINATYQTAASAQGQVRDEIMAYIQSNHPETAQIIEDLSWTGGKEEMGLLGAEKYVYTTLRAPLGGAGWTVTVEHSVIPNPTYTITAEYMQSGVASPYGVSWEGTWRDGAVTEESYDSNVPSTEEQIRNSIMVYLESNHAETAQFMRNLSWTGGRVETGLLGSEKYTYISGGWNVTMTHPVVLNPIYTVIADYSQQGIGIPYRVIWEGTWQNGIITETHYTFAQ